MICPACHHYRPMGTSHPVSPVCAWRPSPDDLAALRAILPAPMLSRALVQTAPYQVEECAAFAPKENQQ